VGIRPIEPYPPQLAGDAELRDRRRVVAALAEGDRERPVVQPMPRLDSNGLPALRDRPVVIPLAGQVGREEPMGMGVMGIEDDGLPQFGNRLVEAPGDSRDLREAAWG